jgi:hypothetical protein
LTNLIAAEQAVKYANDRLRGRSSNRSEDLAHTLQADLNTKYAGKLGARERVLTTLDNPGNVSRQTQEIYQERFGAIRDARRSREDQGNRLNAAAISADKIGNCFEHAVLACHYLNYANVRSYLVETDENTDHAFVVIGAPGGLAGQIIEVRKNAPGALNGGGLAVVCDPWYHEWFSVQQDWGRKMWLIFSKTIKQPPVPDRVPLTFTDGGQVT